MADSPAPSAHRRAPFAWRDRPRIVEWLVSDPELRAAAGVAHPGARTASGPDTVIDDELRAYAEEIVPHYLASLHHRLAVRLARRLASALYRVRVGHADPALLGDRVPSDAAVIFVVNHRSNMDYVLVSALAAEHAVVSFAAGEWANVWPLANLARGLGAFFVRRGSQNVVYRHVLERYVQHAIDHGVVQAVFPEGGLSRDGRLRPAKLGLIAYATRRLSRSSGLDVIFVPVGINYDRVLEDRTLLQDVEPTGPSRSKLATCLTGAGWIAKNLGLNIRGRLYRFGYACVNFGAPISARRYLEERELDFATLNPSERRTETERFGALLMEEVARVIPVTPVSLVASALLTFEQGETTVTALRARVDALVEELRATSALVYLPREDRGYLVDVGLRTLVIRRLVTRRDDVCRVGPGERALVAYYANAIEHFLERRAPPTAEWRSHVAERAVVLVHGLARTSRSMARLARALEAAGYTVYNWDYPSRRFGVTELTGALNDYARRAATSSRRVDFVTHSMGGLRARGVLERGDFPNVGRLVMLAPPNRGAAMASRALEYAWARAFFGRALDDLRPDGRSSVAARLGPPACEFGVIAGTRSFHPLQPTSYYASIVGSPGPHDGTIEVDETRLPGMADFITVNANHTFIMEHEETIRQTLHFLEHGRFERFVNSATRRRDGLLPE